MRPLPKLFYLGLSSTTPSEQSADVATQIIKVHSQVQKPNVIVTTHLFNAPSCFLCGTICGFTEKENKTFVQNLIFYTIGICDFQFKVQCNLVDVLAL